jgi:hypothetical protein
MTTTTATSTTRPLQTTLSQQVLSLALAAVITAVMLTGLLGEAADGRAALLAQQQRTAAPHAIASVLVVPMA